MTEESSYPDTGAMDRVTLRCNLILLTEMQKFSLGTIWRVGENLWGALLPKEGSNAYVQRQDRINHPGMCVSVTSNSIHAAVPMWYGTHGRSRQCFQAFLDGPGKPPTYFGHFRAVNIGRDLFGESPEARSKKQERAREKYERNHVVRYRPKGCLDATELAELKRYIVSAQQRTVLRRCAGFLTGGLLKRAE